MSEDPNLLRTRTLESYFQDVDDDLGEDVIERSPIGPRRTGVDRVAPASGREATSRWPEIGALNQLSLGRLSLGRALGAVALGLLAALLAMVLDPALPSAALAQLLAPATTTMVDPARAVDGPLTAFSDWRVAYLGEDDRLYVVTPDGQTTLSGPQLPAPLRGAAEGTAGAVGDVGAAASASPDGHWIAALTRASSLALLDLSAAPPVMQIIRMPIGATTVHWSPDSAWLAVETSRGGVAMVEVARGRIVGWLAISPPDSVAQLAGVELLGWLDDERLLVARRALWPGMARIETVTVTTGVVHPLAVVPAPDTLLPRFSLSPDGRQMLAFSGDSAAGAHATVTLIDSATGELRPLPRIARALAGALTAAAWNLGTLGTPTLVASAVVVDPVNPQNLATRVWRLNVADDTTMRQRDYGIPLGWTPDGGSLIYASTTADVGVALRAPTSQFQLRAFSIPRRDGRPLVRPLAESTQPLLFLGFVRTA